tara:strand:+ start:1010 stop:1195 length:186 start_codon:yes stop_codon:yes gene_type:complete
MSKNAGRYLREIREKILPREDLEKLVRKFVSDNNLHAQHGKDYEGVHVVHFLVDDDTGELE